MLLDWGMPACCSLVLLLLQSIRDRQSGRYFYAEKMQIAKQRQKHGGHRTRSTVVAAAALLKSDTQFPYMDG